MRGECRRVAVHALQIHGRRQQLERRRRRPPAAVQHQQAVVVVRIYMLQLPARRRVEEADPERVPRRDCAPPPRTRAGTQWRTLVWAISGGRRARQGRCAAR